VKQRATAARISSALPLEVAAAVAAVGTAAGGSVVAGAGVPDEAEEAQLHTCRRLLIHSMTDDPTQAWNDH